MEYMIISLREAYENDILNDKLDNAIDRFNIKVDYDVSSFLKNNAKRHTEINLSSTFLFIVEDEENIIEILAYYTLVNNKVFNIKKASKKDKEIIQIEEDENNNQAAILIAQLGRNDKFASEDLNIKDIVKLGGGRFVILECVELHLSRYKDLGFSVIKKIVTTTYIHYSYQQNQLSK